MHGTTTKIVHDLFKFCSIHNFGILLSETGLRSETLV
jgi:hypothetical protein